MSRASVVRSISEEIAATAAVAIGRAGTTCPAVDAVLAIRGAMLALLVVLAPLAVAAQPEPAPVELFAREGCPHCAHAEAWLRVREGEGDVVVTRHDVAEDPAALERLTELAHQQALDVVAVPAILARGRLFVGFDDAATTGASIDRWLASDGAAATAGEGEAAYCAAEIEACDGPGAVRVPLLGEVDVERLGLPLFTIVVGLVDGFNPCAMWVLLFLLSMLVHLRDRRRMALVAGTFVVVSALVYLAFMAAWLQMFLLVGVSRVVQLALGVVSIAIAAVHLKDAITPGQGPSLSISASAKPGIYARVRGILRAEHLGAALVLAATLAVMVNTVELLCTAGLPALYTQVLASHGLGGAEHLAYLVLYDVAYMADDTVMVVVGVATLTQQKLQERGGRALQLLSGAIILALGLALLFAPEWLSWGAT